MYRRSRKAGMFRAASRHVRHLGKELGKELAKDIADKSFKKALKGSAVDNSIRLSSGTLKRAKSRLDKAHMTPMNLSTIFDSPM